jgi:chromosome partitioning protein
MPILSVASTKGGVSKTTLVVSLADWWRRQGRRVTCLDMDPNKNLLSWIGEADLPGLTVRPVTEDDVFDDATDAAQTADIVIIDVAGVLSRGMLLAFGASDAVLIPSGTSYGDIFEAGRTQAQVRNAIKAARKHNPEANILHAVALTKVNRRAAVTQASRQQLAEFEIPVLDSDLPTRTAYQQAWFRSCSPMDVGDPSVLADIETIAHDIGERLGIR